MSILSGFKKVRRHIRLPDGYKLLSFWTSSQSVEMDDGTTLESNKTKWDDASDKKHEHANKSALDSITSDNITKWNDMSTNIDATIGQKANQTELDTHVNNSAIHFSASERTKLAGVETEANKYTHPSSAAGAKSNGLYKITTDANGHVTGATAVTKADITNLGIPASDTNTTYSQATYNNLGLTKLYTYYGDNTDGTITQQAITDLLDSKITKPSVMEVKPTSYNSYGVPLYYMGNATFAILIITCGTLCCVALIQRDGSSYYRYKIISSGGYISVSDSEWSSTSSAFIFQPYPGVTYKMAIFAIA